MTKMRVCEDEVSTAACVAVVVYDIHKTQTSEKDGGWALSPASGFPPNQFGCTCDPSRPAVE